MIDPVAARQQLADAVTSAGLPCLPYEPDNASPPIAFVDQMHYDYETPVSFAIPAMCRAVIVTCGQRNDRQGSLSALESLTDPIVDALQTIPDLSMRDVISGNTEIGRAVMPAVSYVVEFPPPCT